MPVANYSRPWSRRQVHRRSWVGTKIFVPPAHSLIAADKRRYYHNRMSLSIRARW